MGSMGLIRGQRGGTENGKRKPEKIVLCGIIGHLPLRGRCPKRRRREKTKNKKKKSKKKKKKRRRRKRRRRKEEEEEKKKKKKRRTR